MVYKNTASYQNIRILNGTWNSDISEAIIEASMSMSISEVMQLTISVDDPGLSYFSKNNVPLNTFVNYHDLGFSIASIEVGAGGGEGGFVLECRPRGVRWLKERRGAHTLRNVSPSQYIQQECAAVGVKSFVQPSAKRSSISRDVTEKGQKATDEQSAWSTFNRLANELGYMLFEIGGTVFFGQPTWFVKSRPRVQVSWNQNDGYDANSFPQCRRSLDDEGRATVTVSVPLERAGDFMPGHAMVLKGVPRFDGTYFVTAVDYPLAGPGQVTVTAETPFNPVAEGTQ